MELTVMIDCSRNAVMKPEMVKEFAGIIKNMGYTGLMLYTEDTYEVENEPYFGYMRGGYTMAELKDMDAYCGSIGIELIPCIQVLAHLGHLPRWEDYYLHMDAADVLLVGDERVYTLIDNMLSTVAKCYTTRKVHIGMDEAFYLGVGKYLHQHGYRNRSDILVEHLNRVKALTDKHGLQPMMWSDMFFHLAEDPADGGEKHISQEILDKVPEGVTLVYWDYCMKEKSRYDSNLKAHRQFVNNKIAFAGGICTWTGYAPNLQISLDATQAALESAGEHGVDHIIMTMWGDDGKDCSYFAALPGLFAAAQMACGNVDRADIAEKFCTMFGYSFAEFMNLELPNITDEEESHANNPSKYLLFNDPLLGLFDYTIHDGLKDRYKAAIPVLEKSINGRQYDYLFDFYTKLTELLAHKCDLGVRLKKAYMENDKEMLKKLADEEFPPMQILVRQVYEAFRTLWYRENKSIGFEMQEMRFGALLLRNENCQRMIYEYLNGQLPVIQELELPRLPGHYGKEGKGERFNSYIQTISTNVNAY